MNSDMKDRLLDLIEKHIEDRLEEKEVEELEQLVISNDDAAKMYSNMMQQHALLHMSSTHMSESLEIQTQNKTTKIISIPSVLFFAASIFLVLGLSVIFYPQNTNSTKAPIAIIVSSNYASWGNCTLPTAEHEVLTSGRLELLEGLVTLKFNSGAEMILEGPTKIDLIDPMNTVLYSGIVVTEIPDSAKGFTIQTPTSKAVDHGTKFLTQVSPEGDTTLVNVLEGEVEVVHDQKGSHHIFKGEMIKTTDEQLTQKDFGAEIGLGYAKTSSSETLSISTDDGRGDDGTAFKMNLDFHYNSELIMIKNSANEFNRKGYLKFDLSKLGKGQVESVSLDFSMVHSQFGSLALSEALAKFSIYAVSNDELDSWIGGLMPWESAPANGAGSTEVLMDQAIKLGEFNLPRGKVKGKISFQSPELTEAVNQDKNRLLTIIIVHESFGDQIGANYVYAIASKNHPSLTAPTLYFNR